VNDHAGWGHCVTYVAFLRYYFDSYLSIVD
jgi:hypothetical protein